MNKLDELFKNKLENYSLPPREEAWNRIQACVEKKSSSAVWWYAAAAVLLLTIVGWWTYTWKASEVVENNYLANGKPEEKIMPSTSKALAQLTKTEQKKSHVNTTTTIHKQLPKVALVEARSTVTQLTEAAPVIAKEDVANNQAADASLTNVKEGKTTTLASTEKTETPIVLEFSLQPISSEVVATAQADKKSLKNVLMDLKNGETNFNFQTIKENFFAFNQKKNQLKAESR